MNFKILQSTSAFRISEIFSEYFYGVDSPKKNKISDDAFDVFNFKKGLFFMKYNPREMNAIQRARERWGEVFGETERRVEAEYYDCTSDYACFYWERENET